MKGFKLIFGAFVFAVMLCALTLSCKKKNETPNGNKLFTYTDITTEHTEIIQGNVTNVTAHVSGEVTYQWACSSGDLFGSGKSILFGAGSCCTGEHIVTCTVKDKNNNTESKSVTINVK